MPSLPLWNMSRLHCFVSRIESPVEVGMRVLGRKQQLEHVSAIRTASMHVRYNRTRVKNADHHSEMPEQQAETTNFALDCRMMCKGRCDSVWLQVQRSV